MKTPSPQGGGRTYAITATVAGVIAVVAAVLAPFLPVSQNTAAVAWPQTQQLSAANASVTAPLAAQTPEQLDMTISCAALAHIVDAGPRVDTVIVSTTPKAAGSSVFTSGLAVTHGGNGVSVSSRGSTLVTVPDDQLRGCSELTVWSTATEVGARFDGLDVQATANADSRPQVAGVFTDLDRASVQRAEQSGLSVAITIDDRFDTTASALKIVAIVIAVLAALVALVALAHLDRIGGHRGRVTPRPGFRTLFAPRITDVGVTAALVIWHFLGAGTADDGYVLGMAKNGETAGYLSNYYRFFGVPEAPFDWYYSFLGLWSHVSTAGIWMKLPALLAGLASWFLLSRVLLPRLGRSVSRSTWPMLAAAAVFVAFWIAFCSGLRPEPIIVVGTLATWSLVEVAIATRRLVPAAVATFSALLTLAAAPHGIIAIAVLIAGSRPMLRICRHRRAEFGLLPLAAPVAAAGALILVIVFRTQSLGNVAEAVRVRYATGPTLEWYQELLRYYYMTLGTEDGALARRIPVLLLLLSLIAATTIALRRRRLPGVSPGPMWRLIGTIFLTIALLSLTPTKWTVQFGVFAGVGAAVAAVATAALIRQSATSPRTVWGFLTAVVFAAAVASAGHNAWGWTYDFGISWFDKAPVFAGIPLTTLLLALAALCMLVTVWVSIRPADAAVTDERRRRRRRLVAGTPILLVAALLVVGEFALFAKAAVGRTDTYTALSANVRALTGDTCGLADKVLVEDDPNAGTLTPVGTDDVSAALAGDSVGFTPDGVSGRLEPDAVSLGAGTINTAHDLARSFVGRGGVPGTTGGTGPETVNGSTVALPFGLDPDTTPVLGSYGYDNGTARLTSTPYRLPDRSASPLIVITAAGSIMSVDQDGAVTEGRDLKVEFGTVDGGEFRPVGTPFIPIDPGPDSPNRPWRNLRIPMSAVPAGADALRIVAVDSNVSPSEWLAVTPPRAPRLQTLQDVVGSTSPVLLDLSVGSQFPCQHSITVTDGVYQVPQWRITPDLTTTVSKSDTWQATDGGGVLTASESLTKASALATYLENDWHMDWGNLLRLTPVVPGIPTATVQTGTAMRSGWYRPGSIRVVSDDE
ncbi:arabinosyltransferase domain-containing protein [Gordonia shandongensis]|uniref:arabinosyltransferase domain-containing protein n=1 Tax=Gordonia shandongensis TaxID=376351 RepID=UPI0004265D52|nr:arabinosyltransferase domain-containing protein [Gordonia shandongensis]